MMRNILISICAAFKSVCKASLGGLPQFCVEQKISEAQVRVGVQHALVCLEYAFGGAPLHAAL